MSKLRTVEPVILRQSNALAIFDGRTRDLARRSLDVTLETDMVFGSVVDGDNLVMILDNGVCCSQVEKSYDRSAKQSFGSSI
mmetsp:Transcript_31953/g.77711  ORF Transcript_31953/g.77711 Transcript_31953/m.77711 type:complete len:82 (-) Transcript_31953:198-443(-)